MIIIHTRHDKPFPYQNVEVRTDKGKLAVDFYACGIDPPNYPMPAIPIAVCLAHDCVLIAEVDYFEGELEFNLVYEYPN